jgi:hypothetical protein
VAYLRRLLFVLAVFAGLTSFETAEASGTPAAARGSAPGVTITDGYVCGVLLEPSAIVPSYGAAGHIWLRVFANADCSGQFNVSEVLSTGATVGDTRYVYSEPQLLSIYNNLVQAMLWGRRVEVQSIPINFDNQAILVAFNPS